MEDYFNDCELLISKLNFKFDCVVSLKRSGWILGVLISNRFKKPLFTVSEIKSLPSKFINVLVVDDKICTGKSFNKVKNMLKTKSITTASLYIERDVFTDYWVKQTNKIIKMWYE